MISCQYLTESRRHFGTLWNEINTLLVCPGMISYQFPGKNTMPKPAPKDARAVELGGWLMQQRLARGLKRPETVQLALQHDPRAALSPDYLSKLEYGTRNLAAAALDIREAIREALKISRPDWEAATGLATGDPLQSAVDLVRMGAEPINGEYPVPLLGDVAAGGRMDTFIPVENAEEWIDAGRGLAMRYGLSHLYALRVTGDSMYSERARFNVPDNSVVIVHRELEPVRGDIVVAYIEELDVGVIKSYGEPEDATLSSYNPTGPVYRANQFRIRLCGVVVETRTVPLTRRNGFH